MSVVIASKYQNGVIMMSDRQVTRYGIQAIKNSVEKIYKVPNTSIIIGGVGTLRDLQQIKKVSENLFNIREELTEKECIEAVDKITIEYRKNLYIEPNEIVKSLKSCFLFCDGYNINYIGFDLSVINNLDYFAIGSRRRSSNGLSKYSI